MKSTYYLAMLGLFLFLSALTGHTQPSNFELQIPTYYVQDEFFALQKPDSSWLMASVDAHYLFSDTKDQNISILHVKKDGKLQSRHYYGYLDDLQQFEFTPDNGRALLEFKYLCRTNPAGDPIWAKSWKLDGHTTYPRQFLQMPDSGFLVLANLVPPTTWLTQVCLLRIDANGALRWARALTIKEHYLQSTCMQLLPDGRLLIGGEIDRPFSHLRYPLLIMADTAAQVQWVKYFQTSSEISFPNPVLKMAAVDSQTVAVAFATNEYGAGDFDISIVKMKTDGTLISGSVYGTEANETLTSMRVAPGGRLFLHGRFENPDYENEAPFYAEIGSDNAVLSSWKAKVKEREPYLKTARSVDGSTFLMRGLTVNNNQAKIVATKFPDGGRPGCNSFDPVPLKMTAFEPQFVSNIPIDNKSVNLSTLSLNIWDSLIVNTANIQPCIGGCLVKPVVAPAYTRICVGDTLAFDNRFAGTIDSFQWYINNVPVAGDSLLRYAWDTPGNYKVTLYGFGAVCKDSAFSMVEVLPRLKAGFTYQQALHDVQFSETSPGAWKWQWDFGDGHTSSLRAPRHVFDTLGVYNVCLTAYGVRDTQTVCKPIYVIDGTQKRFYQSYLANASNPGGQNTYAVTQTIDGGFMITGQNSHHSNGSLLMMKSDAFGIPQWTRHAEPLGYLWTGYSVQQCFDRGYIFCGNLSNQYSGITKTNEAGLEEWRYWFSNNGIQKCIQVADSGYVHTGATVHGFYVGKLDKYGHKQWQRYYYGGKTAQSILQTPDGGYLVAGEARTGGKVYVIKVDADGMKQWSKEYVCQGVATSSSLTPLRNGHYLIAGATRPSGVDKFIFLLEITPEGNVVRAKKVVKQLDGSVTFVTETSAGDIMLVGSHYHSPMALKLTSEGARLWGYVFSLPSAVNAYGVKTYDEGLALTANDQGKTILTKITGDGKTGCKNTLLQFSTEDFAFSASTWPFDSLMPVNVPPLNTSTDYNDQFAVIQTTECYFDACSSLKSNLAVLATACNETPTGAASVSPSGGTGPYSIQWNTGSGESLVAELPSGVFHVSITDARGCVKVDSAVVLSTHLNAAVSSLKKPDCSATPNGELALEVATDAAGFTVLWNTGDTTAALAGLAPGMYSYLVHDANDCVFSDSIFLPRAELHIEATTTRAACNGENSGKAVVTILNEQVPPISIHWSNNAATSVIAGLSSQTYAVTVTDGNFCVDTDTAFVPSSTLLISASVTDASCYNTSDGSVSVQINENSAPPATFIWPVGAATATGLHAGAYTVQVRNQAGCEIFQPVAVASPEQILLQVVSTPDHNSTSAPEGKATATASNGVPPYTYLWNNGQSGSSIGGLLPGLYTVTVTDGQGCTALAVVVVDMTIGTHDPDRLNQLRLYPNPVAGEREAILQGADMRWGLRLFSTDGRQIEIQISEAPDGLRLQFPALPPGLYRLEATDPDSGAKRGMNVGVF